MVKPQSCKPTAPRSPRLCKRPQIEGLPTFGNNITRLTLLSPGAFMASGQLDLHPENAGEDFDVNINGGQTRNNAHILDGVDNTETIQGLSMVVTPQDAVQEIKVTTSNYDAQYGNVSGGVNRSSPNRAQILCTDRLRILSHRRLLCG